MCLAIPSRIVQIDDLRAVVDVYGARREINLMLMPEEVGIGDYVLVHAGFALQKVEQEAAQEALQMISKIIEDVEKEDDSAEGYSCQDSTGNQRIRNI
ncbi:MAG: HypC/HybG/HupF family hydrogenase formation chaperone [Thermodesulfovibrio sp.]|nr:HypC/HybG/HupF family hydrogenase formation chaperone [Thermodesulfovibrio sp.]